MEAPLLDSSTTGCAHSVQHVSNSGQSTWSIPTALLDIRLCSWQPDNLPTMFWRIMFVQRRCFHSTASSPEKGLFVSEHTAVT